MSLWLFRFFVSSLTAGSRSPHSSFQTVRRSILWIPSYGRLIEYLPISPTRRCSFTAHGCDYCFEHKEPHRLSSLLVPLLTRRLLYHLEREGIEECEIYWKGGEAMIVGPAWFADAGKLMDSAAAERGRRFTHYHQTNLISYSPAFSMSGLSVVMQRVCRSVRLMR